jgi:hypothetical protein
MAGSDMKAELSGRRDRAVVHICESGGQLDGICRLFSDVSKLGEEEVGVLPVFFVFAPRVWLRYKGWGNGVHGLKGSVFALTHVSSCPAERNNLVY